MSVICICVFLFFLFFIRSNPMYFNVYGLIKVNLSYNNFQMLTCVGNWVTRYYWAII